MNDLVNGRRRLSTRRDFLKALGLGTATMTLSEYANIARGSTVKKGKDKPNIILFLTDDQGWTDTSVQMMAGRPDSKSDFYQTPNLERLAKEGMRFSNAYSPGPLCSPSRHSIQFGKTPARLHTTTHAGLMPMNEDETALPQMIKAANPNYVTAHFGKWHIKRSPEDMGYDKSDGSAGNGDGNFDKVKGKRVPLPDDDPKRIFSTTRKANDFMAEQVKKVQPFFMQVSHYAVHVAHAALESTMGKYQNLVSGDDPDLVLYAAMTEDLDTGLGLLLDKVDELGIADNTYIIYMSDNGGGFQGNEPLAKGKGSLQEGGIRVPMVVRGPGIKPGSFCDVPVAGWDFFPTISDLIGNENPLPEGIDGGSLLPLFENAGKGKVKRPDDYLVFHFPEWTSSYSAIRKGDYKLIKCWDDIDLLLFDLAKDIGESKNLAYLIPEKAEELHKDLMNYLKIVDAEDPLRGREFKRLQKLEKAKKG